MANWGDMSSEIKSMIVGNMDFFTRTRLSMCSKADNAIVASTPINIRRLTVEMKLLPVHPVFQQNGQEDPEWDFITREMERLLMDLGRHMTSKEHEENYRYRIEMNVKDWDNLTFEVANDNKVDYTRRYTGSVLSLASKEEAFKWMHDFYANLLLNEATTVGNLKININLPDNIANHGAKLKVKSVELDHREGEETLKWLNVLDSSLEKISMFDSSAYRLTEPEVMGRVISHPLVINAKELSMNKANGITDEQMLQLKCEKLHFDLGARRDRTSRLTTSGIRRLLEKVIAGDYPIGSKWDICWQFDLNTILRGYQTIKHISNLLTYVFVPINNVKKIEIIWAAARIEIHVVPYKQKYVDHYSGMTHRPIDHMPV